MRLCLPANERPPLPADEEERLASLRRYALLDTPPEAAFDRLTALAARLFGVPLALVTLVDSDRQWFKSCQGSGADGLSLRETCRDSAFCAHTILSDEPVVFEDTRLDPRSAQNPLVTGALGLRFYAGAPLLDEEGRALGALCLLDFQPRVFSAEQRAALTDLAASVISEMDLRRASVALAESERLYRRMFEDSPHPMWVFDCDTLRFLAVNETALGHYGYTRAEFLSMTLADIRLSEDVPALHEARPGSGLRPGDRLLRRHRKKDGTLIWVEIAAHTADYEGRPARMVIASDITERKQADEALHRSLAMMKAQQEAAPDGILVVDEHRRIVSYNQRLCEMWGIPDEISRSHDDERLLGHVLSQVKQKDQFLRRVQFLYETPSEQSHEEIELKDGRIFDRCSGPMDSDDGEYYGRVWFFRDITEHRRMEEALSQTERKRALHIRQTPMAAIEWSLDFEVIAWNPAAEKIFGYTEAEALGRRGPDLILPESQKAPVDAIRVALLSGTGGTRSTNLNRTKDGREILCEWYNTPLVDDDGRVIGVAALAQDVTERARAETALRESEARSAAILEAALDCVVSTDHQGQIIEWNPAAADTFGYSRAEALGQGLASLIIPPRLREAHAQGLSTYLAGAGGPILDRRIEIPALRRDGVEFQAELAVTAITAGPVPIFTAYLRDITERRQAEAQLQESRQRYKSLVEYHPHTVCSIDTQGNFLSVNAAFERLTGYTEAEVCGRSFAPLVAPECLTQSRWHYEQTLQGHPQRHDLTLLHKTGRRVEARLTTVPIVVDDAVIGIYAVAEDVTERKALESEREALLTQTEVLLADALERADHDPLTGLINHRAFHKRLEEQSEAARREGRPLGLLLLDLNDFKFFNDAYGHLAGDDVLRRVAEALRAVCRAGDVLARFGGDEFALLMPGAGPDEAARAAGLLRQSVARVGYRPPGHDTPIPLRLSIGTACAPTDGSGRVALLEAADARLRVAQSGGDDEGQAMRLRRGLTRSVEGFSMLDALVTAVDNKDRYTRRHSEDVLAYSVCIARALGMDAQTQHVVEVAALLHDVGKIGVPDAILRKPGRLTDDEFAAVKQHPLMGSAIVGAVPGFDETLDAVRHHHERWDGEGYPFGLCGAEIPLLARLMAVADAYSAMTTDRPYRKGMEPARARRLLEEGAGTQWDPACVAAFLGSGG